MIRVIYYRSAHRLTLQGHAESAEKGQDLVCAGVSALVLTLASNVVELAAADQARHPILRIREGDTWVSCVPAPKMNAVVTMIFDAVCSGLELLQTLYPENIQYSVRENN